MIANLPLLFANGNPTALSKITAAELEKFITFMVTCSWGHDTACDIRQPPWWPHDVEFAHPFTRPAAPPADWLARLQNLVKRCYEYHKSAFLLVFSAQLARYPRARLRYVDNHDHTTSLYYRPTSRLLVTFRNENLFYDKDTPIEIEDEPSLKSTDIYLCDNCDSHFDNYEVLKAHERLCNAESLPAGTCSGGLPEFISALKLQAVGGSAEPNKTDHYDTNSKPKCSRSVTNIDRGPPYPFSSLAYIRNSKCNIQRDTSFSRERVERYCCTSSPFSKYLGSKSKNQQFPIRYRRPIDYWNRKHVFPNQRNKKILDLKAQLYLLKCRKVTVSVERMSQSSMQELIASSRRSGEARVARDVVYVDSGPWVTELTEGQDPLTRGGDCEVIDLCSDDEDSVNENCDPCADVACVMRGGAVLRRTAPPPASPHTAAPPTPIRLPPSPLQPCGTRRPSAPLAHALLHPHPVILIAHTLKNMQTISLE